MSRAAAGFGKRDKKHDNDSRGTRFDREEQKEKDVKKSTDTMTQELGEGPYITNMSWAFFRTLETPHMAGRRLHVDRYYFKSKVAIDVVGRAGPDEKERAYKRDLLNKNGIIYTWTSVDKSIDQALVDIAAQKSILEGKRDGMDKCD